MANRAIFLDRDDTLIEDPGYISDPNQVRLLEGTGKALKQFSDLGFKLVIITNQSGIARGILDEQKLEQIHQRLRNLLSMEGVFIDSIYYCPYHPDGKVEKYTKESHLRKPQPGMLLKAEREMQIDLENSWMIGNSDRDVKAGKDARCKTILIEPSYKQARIKYTPDEADYVVTNITEAANIVKRESSKQNLQKQNNDLNISTAKVSKTQSEAFIKEDKPVDKTVLRKKNNSTEESAKQQYTADEQSQHHYLREIHSLMKARQRDKMFSEFTGLMLVGFALQGIVCLLVLLAIWQAIKAGNNNAFLLLNFAIVFQLIVLTFCVMKNNK